MAPAPMATLEAALPITKLNVRRTLDAINSAEVDGLDAMTRDFLVSYAIEQGQSIDADISDDSLIDYARRSSGWYPPGQ